jgi:hypothetical protein
VSSMPLGGRMQPENHGSATIGKAVKVVGKIYSKEDLLIAAQLGTFLRENDASPREPGRLALFGYFAQRFKVAYR